MKISQVYLKAAASIAEKVGNKHSPYCCDRIYKISKSQDLRCHSKEIVYFESLYKPNVYCERGWWDEPPMSGEKITKKSREVQNIRRFALCLAAAIAESEGL